MNGKSLVLALFATHLVGCAQTAGNRGKLASTSQDASDTVPKNENAEKGGTATTPSGPALKELPSRRRLLRKEFTNPNPEAGRPPLYRTEEYLYEGGGDVWTQKVMSEKYVGQVDNPYTVIRSGFVKGCWTTQKSTGAGLDKPYIEHQSCDAQGRPTEHFEEGPEVAKLNLVQVTRNAAGQITERIEYTGDKATARRDVVSNDRRSITYYYRGSPDGAETITPTTCSRIDEEYLADVPINFLSCVCFKPADTATATYSAAWQGPDDLHIASCTMRTLWTNYPESVRTSRYRIGLDPNTGLEKALLLEYRDASQTLVTESSYTYNDALKVLSSRFVQTNDGVGIPQTTEYIYGSEGQIESQTSKQGDVVTQTIKFAYEPYR